MKCSVCGQEFGPGAVCQSCGVDRVTGLGNYSGYHAPTSNQANGTDTNNRHIEILPNNCLCWNCGEVIPESASFCPFCSTKLKIKCHNCGHTHISRYRFCPDCGSSLTDSAPYLNYEELRNKYISEQSQIRDIKDRYAKLEIENKELKKKCTLFNEKISLLQNRLSEKAHNTSNKFGQPDIINQQGSYLSSKDLIVSVGKDIARNFMFSYVVNPYKHGIETLIYDSNWSGTAEKEYAGKLLKYVISHNLFRDDADRREIEKIIEDAAKQITQF